MPRLRTNAEAEIDRRLGLILRQYRHAMDLSQEDFAAKVSLSYQQIQKYECGGSRVSVSRLATFADLLGTSAELLFRMAIGTEPPETPFPRRVARELFSLSARDQAVVFALIRALAQPEANQLAAA